MSNETFAFLTPDRLAPLSVGSWVNLVLFTLEFVQATQYFRSSARPRDSLFIKLGVGLNLLANLVGTMACCATTHLYTVTYWGNTEALDTRYWPLTVLIITVGVVTAVSQLFMVIRYWQMTRHHLVFALMVLILLSAVAGIFGSGVLMALSLTVDRMLHDGLVFLALIASAVGSALVSILLLAQFCKRNDNPISSWSLLKRVFCALLETGTLTTLVIITGSGTAAFEKTRHAMVWIVFAFIIARVYSCTMLFALSRRSESTTTRVGNAFEVGYTDKDQEMVDQISLAKPGVSSYADVLPHPTLIHLFQPPVAVLEDSDAFQLTKKKIELHERDFDSDSDVSRNLNDELHNMDREVRGGSRKSSFASSRRESFDSAGEDSPSEYPGSPLPDSSLRLP
ncbi:hypothetical protein C8F04DRAFT_1078010 [Mycena alexandri]|uniref:Transmembrane protein n=1 Tax=Mycena alexandri TaxID=1745969 RepID=A0AAD6X7L4_9AGAR|nr:hypothetical protein C8F04DRAFT_1078010 [Mycena alexandri]